MAKNNYTQVLFSSQAKIENDEPIILYNQKIAVWNL
jgi:hypothetical protein